MKKTLLFTFFLIGIFSCKPTQKVSSNLPSDAQLIAVLQENMDALTAEDVERSMATIDPSSPQYGATEEVVGQIFEMYDLQYTLEKPEVLEKTADRAVVKITQTTKKVNGPEFKDNQIVTKNELRKQADGSWKVFSTEILEIKYLED